MEEKTLDVLKRYNVTLEGDLWKTAFLAILKIIEP
jgi:hypothetical protein